MYAPLGSLSNAAHPPAKILIQLRVPIFILLCLKGINMEYIVFIHNNTDSATTDEQWQTFFTTANASGIFQGGSEISNQTQIGNKSVQKITNTIAGFMRFEAENKNTVLALLEKHPVIIGLDRTVCECRGDRRIRLRSRRLRHYGEREVQAIFFA